MVTRFACAELRQVDADGSILLHALLHNRPFRAAGDTALLWKLFLLDTENPPVCVVVIALCCLPHTCSCLGFTTSYREFLDFTKALSQDAVTICSLFPVDFHLICSKMCWMPALLVAEVRVSCMVNLTQ